MKSRTWFVLSITLFIGAAYFWRLGNQKLVSEHRAKEEQSAIAREKQASSATESPTAPAVSSKKLLTDTETNSAATNSTDSTSAPVLYPHRLQNTSQSIEELVRNDKAILLRNAHIDTDKEAIKIPDELRAKGDPGSYIVQSRGVVDATFRAALIEANAEIISYVPNNAFLVRVGSGGAKQLTSNKQVQSVLPYEPYYKLDTDLLASVMEKKEPNRQATFRVTLFPGQLDSTLAALKGKATVIGEDANSSPFGPELILAAADLVQLANLPQVQGIEQFLDREKLNDLTRVRVGVSTNTVVLNNFMDLGGTNVLVNVNDTPIDNAHPDLTGRIFPLGGTGIQDFDGHGTHVAGIIASSGENSPTGAKLEGIGSLAGADFRGKAPGVEILSLDIFAGFSDARLQRLAAEENYITRSRPSPLISNNSWGYGTPSYNSSSASFDAAVRDALPGSIGSQPIAYVFAAGNSGGGNNAGQGGSSGTVLSPGNAKNVITVGAIENKRDITNEVTRPNAFCVTNTTAEFLGLTDSSNQVASFSSRGNVGVSQEGTFGRLKPDVVAPGTFVVSTRSGQFDEASYYSPLHVDSFTFPGLVLDPPDTNFFSVFVPDDPCDSGAIVTLTVQANVTSPITTPPVSLLIYGGTNPVPSVSGTLLGVNSVTNDRADLPLNDIFYYDVVNTNDFEVTYNLRTSMVLSNDLGDYFQVLSNLNETVGEHYMFESGTSMAAPAISGMLALMQEFFEDKFQITNSPAMMKALLINGSRSAGPAYSYERERSINSQGWGLPDLRRIIPTNAAPETWPMQLFDQSTNVVLSTGDQHDRVVTMTDLDSPLRITLVWTDPPGNPAVGVKLVNDLDLIVTSVVTNTVGTNQIVATNVYFGNNFPGGEFTVATEMGTNGLSEFDLVRDSVNNVENVYINAPLNGEYTVSVVGRRVNVNAVTAHTNGIVQDYALVISGGNLGTTAPFTVETNNTVLPNTNSFVTVVSNGIPLFKQRVGANSPIQNVNPNNLTDGTNTQWAFYVLENTNRFSNIAFMTFLPPNLSGATNTVPGSRRIVDADIDMYVSTDPTLTNLNPVAIAGADKSVKRGGRELIVYTNRNDDVFYVGIKSEDQRASEFSFFAVASQFPFSDETNGIVYVHGQIVPGAEVVPDGSPDNPGGSVYLGFATKTMNVGRVIVRELTLEHERIGDLIGTLEHEDTSVVLLNHSFPDGKESFPESDPFVGIYDDTGLGLPDEISPGDVRLVDGPGSLIDFEGDDAVGAWLLQMEDNALNATGRVTRLEIAIEPALETNSIPDGNGFTIPSISIPGKQSRGLSFVVPLNATNMIISMAPKEGPIDTVVRRGRRVPTRNPYVDHGALISPPGGSFSVSIDDTPPLRPGRYTIRLFNDGASPVTVSGLVQFELDLTARSLQTYSGGPITLLDDAVTSSIIHVDREALVVSTEVSVRIDHPRVSDLVLHLVSPQGTRVLLAENRGGLSTNGYGFSNLETNLFPATTSGGGTAAQTNIFQPVLNSGVINIDYDFRNLEPDQMQVFYDGALLYDSGLVLGTNTVSIPYGPGVDTSIIVVMNPNGNQSESTLWDYTLTVLSGDLVYATFSENTNLALVPIKFAIPPFATNLPADAVTFDSSYFEDPTVAGTYSAPGTVDGWTVKTNSVDVIGNALQAHRGTNFIELGGGEFVPGAGADILTGPILNPANGHYYYLLAANSWTASEARAITLGGHLATINDAAENNWVYSNFSSFGGVGRALWIGLNDVAQENTFVWTSGQTTTYRNWRPGEPNNSTGSENYVHLCPPNFSPSLWNDLDNNSTFFSSLNGVVEVESASTTGITRTLPTTVGKFYNLKFAYRRAQPATLSSATITLDGVFTNEFVGNPSWIVHSTSFAAPANGTKLDIDGVLPGMRFDTFELTEGGDPNYFLPEESLKALIGQQAKGNWRLEIWDNRVGEPLSAAQLVSWQLHLTFASTNATATPLSSGTTAINVVNGPEIKYFIVDVPLFATHATNVLVSGGGPLNLLFNQDELPIGRSGGGDFSLLSGTVNGTSILTANTFPELQPGRRYYLGVQNANAAQTNFFTLTVTFDDTNNLVNVTPLFNATPVSTNIPLSASMHYYQYDLGNPVGSLRFQLFNLSADADLVVRRNALPTRNSYDFNSNLGGTNAELIDVASPAPGRYYLGVYGFFPTNGIDYTVMVTEGASASAPMFSKPTMSASGFQVSANTVIGNDYEFAVSTNLVNWTVLSTKKATANITLFTDPTPPATQPARFYRLKELP